MLMSVLCPTGMMTGKVPLASFSSLTVHQIPVPWIRGLWSAFLSLLDPCRGLALRQWFGSRIWSSEDICGYMSQATT